MNEPSSKKSKKTVRFSDQADDFDNAQVIQLQQRIMQSKLNFYLFIYFFYTLFKTSSVTCCVYKYFKVNTL